MMDNYQAHYERDTITESWGVTLHDEDGPIDGVATWGKTLRDAAHHIREAAELWFDRPVNIDDDWTGVVGPNTVTHLSEVSRLQDDAESTARRLAAELPVVAAELRERGLTMRDAAIVMGLSHQRIAQLLHQEVAS